MRRLVLILAASLLCCAVHAQPGELTASESRVMPAEDIVCDPVPDTFPLFRGETPDGAFSKWVNSRLRYPEDAMNQGIEGTVLVGFTINEDGRLTSMQILESPSISLGMEALRVLARSPKWTPGTIDGKPVKVRYTYPVDFYLND